MELTTRGRYVVLNLSDVGSVLSPEEGKRDVLVSIASAHLLTKSLEKVAVSVTRVSLQAGVAAHGATDRGPGIDVCCAIDAGKPLVLLRVGRWVTSVELSVRRAMALARSVELAANEAERAVRWTELREPAALSPV